MSTKGNLRTRNLPKSKKSETELKVPVAVASVSVDPVRSTGDLTGQQVSKGKCFLLLSVHILEKWQEIFRLKPFNSFRVLLFLRSLTLFAHLHGGFLAKIAFPLRSLAHLKRTKSERANIREWYVTWAM